MTANSEALYRNPALSSKERAMANEIIRNSLHSALDYIIPAPAEASAKSGIFRFCFDTKIIISDKALATDYDAAKLLKETIFDKTGIPVEIQKGEKKTGCIFMERCEGFLDEEYELTVSEDGVSARASGDRGMLYAVQTLRQLINLSGYIIEACCIKDRPKIQNRGFYHDASRGRIRKLSSYKKLADICSYFKLNQLQLYVEHSFLFSNFTEVCRDDTPLTAEDILELDDYCAKLHIELIPSISTFGHLYKVLRTKSFQHLCELDDPRKEKFSLEDRMQHHTLNVTDERSFEFVKNELDEFLPLFRTDYVNICADETFDLGRGKSRKLAEEIGTGQMYVDFVNKIMKYCIKKGKKPMFWGDIIVGSPEKASQLPKEAICLNWGYSEEEKEDNTRILHDVPVRQYLCPGIHGWNHFINRLDAAYKNVSLMCSYAFKYDAEGVLNTDWGDFGHVQDPAFLVPGLVYGAAFSWSGIVPEDEINRKISRLYYGDASEQIVGIYKSIGMLEDNNWWQFVRFIEHYDGKSQTSELKAFYEELGVKDPEVNAPLIDKKLDELRDLAGNFGDEGVYLTARLILFAEGQKLMSRALFMLGQKLFYRAEDIQDKCDDLATGLERWLYQYKKIWRIDSRESELFRVSDVFCKCADALREYK